MFNSATANLKIYGGVFDFVSSGYDTSFLIFTSGTLTFMDVVVSGGGTSQGTGLKISCPFIFTRVKFNYLNRIFAEGALVVPTMTDIVAISGATVKIVDVFGTTIATLTTDANGQITQQLLKQWTRNLSNGVVGSWITHTPHTVTISKSG